MDFVCRGRLSSAALGNALRDDLRAAELSRHLFELIGTENERNQLATCYDLIKGDYALMDDSVNAEKYQAMAQELWDSE